jgi:hypothetical protein
MQASNAVPRILVWAGLAVFTVYSGLQLVAGPGRDIAFSDLHWTAAAIAEVIALIALFGGVFGRAAYITYRRELARPAQDTLRIPGAPLGFFSELFLTLVGGVLILTAVFMALRIPETILASNTEQYAHYASASPIANIVLGVLFGGIGFVLMILRRYSWELPAGQPVRRYWARAFSRGRVVTRPLRVYWVPYYAKRGYQRIPVGHWLRAEDPASPGFFRDASLAIVPLTTPAAELANIEAAWRARFAQLGVQLASREVVSNVPVAPNGALAMAAAH